MMIKQISIAITVVSGLANLVADTHPVPEHWQIKPVLGKTFWYGSRQGRGNPVPTPNIERFPELAKVLKDNASTIYAYAPGMKISGSAPFFIVGERWGQGVYCDKAGAIYGANTRHIVSFRPWNTIANAIANKGYTFKSIHMSGENRGWKALPGFPQSIDYDFYGYSPGLKSIKIYPATGKNRQIHLRVLTSTDGKNFIPTGEFKGETSDNGHEIAVGKQATHVRVTVLGDSSGTAHIMRTQLLGHDGKECIPYIVSASSEADPLNPKKVMTLKEQIAALKKEYGERFQGFYIGEVCNCLNHNMIEAFRIAPNALYGWKSWVRSGSNFPFRPLSPKSGEETYQNIAFALRKMADSYNWPGPGKPSDAIFMSSFHTWDHYYCEFGSKMAYRELTATNPERQRLEYMFSRSAARQYGIPWKIYTANSFYCVSKQMRDEAKKTREKDGVYKKDSPGLGWSNTSASFSYRNFLSAFMMGCNFYENECAQWFGNWQLFAGAFNKTYAVDPYPGLSPIGKAHIKAMNFALALKDRGVPYTPLAFSVDFKHGISFSFGPWGHGGDESACKEAGREYKMMIETMQTLLPWKDKNFTPHQKFGNLLEMNNLRMANSQFGDVFDVLVPNPPSGLADSAKFNAFKVILLSGKISFTPALTRRYEEFVRQGGILIVNSMYLDKGISPSFAGVTLLPGKSQSSTSTLNAEGEKIAALKHGDSQTVLKAKLDKDTVVLLRDEHANALFTIADRGKGAVITCLVPQMLSNQSEQDYMESKLVPGKLIPGAEYLLKTLHDSALPFKITGDIQFMLNKVSDGWLLTLINNRGLRKLPDGPVEIDDAYTAVVRITPQESVTIMDATELLEKGDNPILEKEKENIVRLIGSVPPGDVRVIKIKTSPNKKVVPMKKSTLLTMLLAAAVPVIQAQTPNTSKAGAVSFASWTLTDMNLRKELASYVTLNGSAATIKAKDKSITYFSPKAIAAKPGESVKVSGKISGKGQAKIGFYAYEKNSWINTVIRVEPVQITSENKSFELILPVTGAKTGSIRPVIIAAPHSAFQVSDLTIDGLSKK